MLHLQAKSFSTLKKYPKKLKKQSPLQDGRLFFR